VWTGSSGTTINPNKPLAMLLKMLNYLMQPVHQVKKLSKKLMPNSEPKFRNSEQIGTVLVLQLVTMVMFCLLGAQMERLQYLGLKRITFGLLDTPTVSRLDVVVTRLDLILVTSAFILTLVSDL
jgi:hypothetical protein